MSLKIIMRNSTKKILKSNNKIAARVIRAYLIYGLSHRKIETEILNLPTLNNGGGYTAMDILHHYNIKESKKNILNNNSINQLITETQDELFKEALILLKDYENDIIQFDAFEQISVFNSDILSDEELSNLGEREPEQTNNSGSKRYKTKPRIAKTVISNNEFKCQNNMEHTSFIDKKGNQYAEAHHLIPMSYQEDFLNLDRKENIVSLCPNCHKAIHLGVMDIRNLIIENLYQIKQNEFSIFNIDNNQLKRMYR